ncbi:MAG TPA: YhjD/YihY/BrkB family envelope integrity protein, partial [Pyrinomonadaceae bacterium]
TFFNSYSATYGSLGAVIILTLWFYFTGAAILIGGEINSEIEHEMALQGEPDAKEKGEKSPNEKEASGGVKPEARDGGTARGKGDQQDLAREGSRRPVEAQSLESTRRDAGGMAKASAPTPPASNAGRGAKTPVDSKSQAGAMRADDARVRADGRRTRLGLGKVAVVFGAWALSKLRGGARKNS